MAQISSGNARAGTNPSRASDSSRNEDSGPAGEATCPCHKRFIAYRVAIEPDTFSRRRLQKATPSTTSASTQGERAPSIPRSATDPRIQAIGRRRQSIREQNAIAPRSARSGTGSIHSGNSSIDLTSESPRNASISSTNSRTSPGTLNMNSKHHSNKSSSENIEFLAPINFDDFHNSILDEPSLNNFPLPGHGGAGYDTKKTQPRSHNQWSTADTTTTRAARSNSLRRQSDVTRFHNQASSINTSMPPPPAPSARSRRQSHVPPPSAASVPARAPRKSVGPGIFTIDSSGDRMSKRRPSLSARKASVDSNRYETHYRLRSTNNNEPDNLGTTPSARSLKAKSLQAPSRERLAQDSLLAPKAGDRSSTTNGLLTPVKPAAGSTNTPSSSSSSKRMSTMPHATGLGARTISPTDARRMKRMSMLPQAPPVPITPPTTQPVPTEVLTLRPRSSQSPSMIPRKSVTPSSSRTTPDPSRKSYSSGMSLSSNTSYNSARNSSGSLQPRLSQTFSSSRLPTPKPRMETVSNGNEEVPPVPAIPKAYESPKTESELVFPTTARKSSLPLDIESARGSDSSRLSTTVNSTTEPYAPTAPWVAGTKTPEGKGKQAAVMSRKSLQPLKLPPLNLLPLSTPMAAKIDALNNNHQRNPSTPPPRTNIPKTPSTPMTASKASFFKNDEDEVERNHLPRSSTSHFLVSTSNTAGYRAPSSSSAVVPLEMPSLSRNMSPYISSSLPKSSSDFNFMRQHLSGEYTNAQSSTKLMGPRPQTQSSAFSVNTETGTRLSNTPDADANGSTLKSKLPSTLRHSVSKPILASDTKVNSAKYDSMPPPRLPASATWNGLSAAATRTTSPTSKSSLLSNNRKSSLASLNTKQSSFNNESNTYTMPSPAVTDPGDAETADNHRPASSILSPVQKMINSAKSNVGTKSRSADPNLDLVELAADEEMRRLGSKRKDFELAAKELDELRRRASPKERVSPAQALKMASLNIFERGEIIDFKDIYFCGTQKAKKHVGDLKSQAANFGYDDERGDYQIVIGDHLAYRYEVVDVLGKGSFGQVVRCVDHKTGQLVAVKIIRNKKRFHQQALVEVNILQKLKEWDPHRKHSVINFTQSFYFRGHLCISTELLGMNLYEFIKAHNFKGFSLKLIRQFTRQMLSTLVLLHSKRVIHCDLKPENILLAHPMRSEIKVIDFGSSCFDHEKVYTYIQSRFYRSPEVILGMSYGMAIDMWSLGCILAELYTGYPIFPGENEQEQLACIMEIFGPPEKHLIDKSTRRKLFFDSLGKPRLTISSKGRRRRPSSKDLRQSLKCDDEPFLDFVARCLRWDPARRMNPNDAMNHEFITGIKPSGRPRAYLSSSNLVSKRLMAGGVTSARPLPEPPSMGGKPGMGSHKATSSSPVKPAAKRLSSVNNMQQPTASKRISNSSTVNNGVGSALPRRNPSGSLAAAAAATSLSNK
ncbi:protein kinase, putative [Talaromyces stipitatus ATCC 10500]|uniref:dual-specificity kinase n=1 Tax=Talaromyces stipitatus (strain ATCC 10500 / CBS 375.48 / QM 6759 / NRRL 1006) TaxID=441959 RepID=B8M5C2_TALSN|nr:protein kinase, putative [Talaromyces stipitatus ATCC 10500]EED19728.1 protein kinase, putative [Talaromyces stipitatus ATCC 10500]